MKKIHKGDSNGTWCRVHNKTWAYKATFIWAHVTCANCLKFNGRDKDGKLIPVKDH